MKKTLLSLFAFAFITNLNAQSIIVNTDFETQTTGLSALTGISGSSPGYELNTFLGVGDIIITGPSELDGASSHLRWFGSLLPGADSVDVQFDIERDNVWSVEHSISENTLSGKYRVSPLVSFEGIEIAALILVDFTYSESYELVSQDAERITVKKTILRKNNMGVLSLSGDVRYKFSSPNVTGEKTSIVSICASINSSSIYDCVVSLREQVEHEVKFKIDNLTIVDKGITIVGIEDEIETKKTILFSYNLMGEEVDSQTKNEVIIIHYSDGTSERVFNH